MFTNIKFKNKYRIASKRFKTHDYSSKGYYFVTICTKNRECYFGDITNDKMVLNGIGKIVQNYLSEISNHFENVDLDENIIMPNHLHGIIAIINDRNARCDARCDTRRDEAGNNIGRDEAVPRLYRSYTGKFPQMSRISPKPKSLSTIVGSFKSICTKTINRKFPNVNFQWQSRFYDHIIRDKRSLDKIRGYIINNPKNWQKDRDNIENLCGNRVE